MERYIDFDETINNYNFTVYDKNNLILIILLLSTEKRTSTEIANLLELHNVKVQYYLEFLTKNQIVVDSVEETTLFTTDKKYQLRSKEILATMDANSELGKKIQARRLSWFLEESIINVSKEDINTIALAEVNLSTQSIVEINTKIKEVLELVLEKEKEAIDEQLQGCTDTKRYALLTSFVPSK